MATNNGYFRTLVPRIGYTRSVCSRNRVRRSFGQSGAVLGVFLYLIFAVSGNGYLTTGYTRSWLFPFSLPFVFVFGSICFVVFDSCFSFLFVRFLYFICAVYLSFVFFLSMCLDFCWRVCDTLCLSFPVRWHGITLSILLTALQCGM